ncbi:LysR family transcriptional regulator [Phyllobacterium sp. SB3]|uniref:LysR family transcriptional regulator n=1 Tax=Phyllobacterium sp. SB3 TaxID=3156073 RepID=UPI0032AE9583
MVSLLTEASGLLAFVRTVESGTFTTAARDLGTSPSVVSKAVARLEKHLGARLFLRSTRALQLTPDGQAFFDRIAPLLKEIDASAEPLQPEAELAGRLRISIPSEIARFLMTPLMAEFAKRYPLLHMEIGITDRYVDLVRENYDVVFRVGEMSHGELMIRRLANIRMVLVASPAFLADQRIPQEIDDLRNLPFAQYLAGGQSHSVRFSNGETIVTHGRVACDSAYGLRAAALEGMGVAHLMNCVVADDLRDGKLIQILHNEPLPSLPFSAIHAFGKTVPNRVRLLCDFVQAQTRSFTH